MEHRHRGCPLSRQGGFSSTGQRTVTWVHAGLAMLVLLVSWYQQSKMRPFVYTFQNSIETWLLLSNFLAIVLVRARSQPGWGRSRVSGDRCWRGAR